MFRESVTFLSAVVMFSLACSAGTSSPRGADAAGACDRDHLAACEKAIAAGLRDLDLSRDTVIAYAKARDDAWARAFDEMTSAHKPVAIVVDGGDAARAKAAAAKLGDKA